MTEVVRFDSQAAMAVEVARRFLTVVSSALDQGRHPQIALTGGTFAGLLYQEIARQAADAALDWTAIDFWWGDERFVAADSGDRNAVEARRLLLDHVGATRIHEMPTPNSACSVDEGARAYEAQLRGSAAGDFDLVLLSMGPDGHIASLFPGSPQASITDRIAVGVTGSPKPPPERITLTFEALSRSERVWIFAADSGPGGAKEDALNRAIAGDANVPATRVHGHEETIWFTC